MSAPAITLRGQMAAEAQMKALFAVFAPAAPATNGSGLKVAAFVTETLTKGQFGTAEAVTDFVTVAGVERPVLRGGLKIPMSAQVPLVGWEYQCKAVDSSTDSALVGRRWRVVAVPVKTYATARRLDVVEVPQ